MDRFKFRVWKNKMQKFHIVFSMHGIVNDTLAGYAKDNNFVLEQCTGLKDKNGRLIYAGDILGNKDFMSDVALLKYNNEKCCYILERQCVDERFNKWWADRLMVIGNIHENKDLLK